jgi:hypothetical protein
MILFILAFALFAVVILQSINPELFQREENTENATMFLERLPLIAGVVGLIIVFVAYKKEMAKRPKSRFTNLFKTK